MRTTRRADGGIRQIELHRERVMLRRAVRGMQMAINVRVSDFIGVAVRDNDEAADARSRFIAIPRSSIPLLVTPMATNSPRPGRSGASSSRFRSLPTKARSGAAPSPRQRDQRPPSEISDAAPQPAICSIASRRASGRARDHRAELNHSQCRIIYEQSILTFSISIRAYSSTAQERLSTLRDYAARITASTSKPANSSSPASRLELNSRRQSAGRRSRAARSARRDARQRPQGRSMPASARRPIQRHADQHHRQPVEHRQRRLRALAEQQCGRLDADQRVVLGVLMRIDRVIADHPGDRPRIEHQRGRIDAARSSPQIPSARPRRRRGRARPAATR